MTSFPQDIVSTLLRSPEGAMSGPLTVFHHRPYRALSLRPHLQSWGLTSQAIEHHPFGVLDPIPPRYYILSHFLSGQFSFLPFLERTCIQMCQGCHGNEHTEVPPTLRTHGEHETRWSACSQENVENHSVQTLSSLMPVKKHDGTLKPPDRLLHNCLE